MDLGLDQICDTFSILTHSFFKATVSSKSTEMAGRYDFAITGTDKLLCPCPEEERYVVREIRHELLKRALHVGCEPPSSFVVLAWLQSRSYPSR